VTAYRVGNHQPQNLYRDDQYIGVMFTAEDAALVVEALNHVEQAHGPARQIVVARYPAFPDEVIASALAADCDGTCHEHPMANCPALPADSCTCPPPSGPRTMPDPLCVVHRGRRAKGPKPPPLGPGCICDGSGRTCPRHGAVI
jgi:hypothetical protein